MEFKIKTEELENRIVDKIIKRLIPEIELRLIHHLYDEEIKGYEKTSRMLDISESTLRSYVQTGKIRDRKHYFKKQDKKQASVFFIKKELLEMKRIESIKF